MAIGAILVSISVSMYRDKTRSTKRLDATTTLLKIAHKQALYRNNNSKYGTVDQFWGKSSLTTKGYYQLAMKNITANGYTIIVTVRDLN